MTNFVVGRSEGVAYPNNNLTYRQFTKDNLPFVKKREDVKMVFIDEKVKEIKQAKNDEDIKEVLRDVYYCTQYDSSIRAEFDNMKIDK